MRTLFSAAFVVAPLFASGCMIYGPNHGPDEDEAGLEPEGTYAGECHDGEDDDRDGLVDCGDDDCADAANCQTKDVVDPDDSAETEDTGGVNEEGDASALLGPDPVERLAVPVTTGAALLGLALGGLRRRRG